jgi:hypothetical protein
MNDAGAAPVDAARAASNLARARWGRTRVNGLIRELGRRHDELGPVQRAQLKFIAELDGDAVDNDNTNDEGDR